MQPIKTLIIVMEDEAAVKSHVLHLFDMLSRALPCCAVLSCRQAKEDSLAALPVCLRQWGPAAVKPHIQAVSHALLCKGLCQRCCTCPSRPTHPHKLESQLCQGC